MTIRVSSHYEGKGFNQKRNSLIFSTILECDKLYNNNSTFISPIYTFPWRETYLFARQIKVQQEKSTLIILFKKEKMQTFAGNKYPSVHFCLHEPRLLHLLTEKSTGPNRRKWTSKWLFPR